MKIVRDTEMPTPFRRYQNAVKRAQGIAQTPMEEFRLTRAFLRWDPEATEYLNRAERFWVASQLASIAAVISLYD